MNKIILILIGIVVGVGLGVGGYVLINRTAKTVATGSTKTYLNTTYGFSLAYPATWSVREVSGNGAEELNLDVFITPEMGLISNGIEIKVGPQTIPATVTPLVNGAKSMTIGGRPGKIFKIEPGGNDMYFVNGDKYRYGLITSNSPTNESTAALTAAVQSFQLLQ